MRKSAEKFLEKLKEDKVFAEKILTQTEKEKVIELARTEGISIIPEDIDEVNAILQKAIEVEKLKTEGELSEDELENVAGGIFGIDDVFFWGAVTAMTACITAIATISVASASAAVTVTVTKSNND